MYKCLILFPQMIKNGIFHFLNRELPEYNGIFVMCARMRICDNHLSRINFVRFFLKFESFVCLVCRVFFIAGSCVLVGNLICMNIFTIPKRLGISGLNVYFSFFVLLDTRSLKLLHVHFYERTMYIFFNLILRLLLVGLQKPFSIE